MRHISQKLRDVLLLGDGPGEEVIQAELVEFKSVRIGKYKQELKDVFKEFQEIAMHALIFEDFFLDSEFNKLTHREMKVFLEKYDDKTVKLEDDDKVAELKKAETNDIEKGKIEVGSGKLQIQKLKVFVQSGCGESSASCS